MPAVVTKISPGRGRPGALLTIEGTGFNVLVGQNQVTMGGVAAGINTASEEQLVVVAPAGMPVDQHVLVEVTNLADPPAASWWWWSKGTVASTAAMILRTKVPGYQERLRGLGRTIKNMGVAEARFFERLAAKIELIPDLLAAKGNFFSHAAADQGLRQAAPGTAGQPFVSRLDASGGRFQNRVCATLQWGRILVTTPAPTDLLDGFCAVNGNDNDNPIANGDSVYDVVPFDGVIGLLSLRERLSTTSRINRVEVYLDDVLAFEEEAPTTTFPGLGIRNGESATLYPNLPVTQGQRVSVRIFRNNTTTECYTLVYALVL